MKLCYIADANSIHTRRWVEPIAALGHEVRILSYQPVTHTWGGGVRVIDLTRQANIRKVRFAYWGWWVRRYVHHWRPHILHTHQLQAAGWLGAMAGYHPFVASAWGSDLLVEPNKSAFRRLLVNIVLRRCDLLTVPSAPMFEAALGLKVPRDKLSLVPWGIEVDKFRPEPDDRAATRKALGLPLDAVIAFCPRKIAPLYNHDILLAAAQQARATLPTLKVALLAYNPDASYLAQLEHMIARERLEDMVHILPPQETQSDMARLYRMAEVMVSIPSTEGYGSSVLEAMGCGCPTIITDLRVFQNEMTDGVDTIKVGPGDITSTAEALVRVCMDAELRDRLRRNGLALAANHSAAARVNQVNTIYLELAAGK